MRSCENKFPSGKDCVSTKTLSKFFARNRSLEHNSGDRGGNPESPNHEQNRPQKLGVRGPQGNECGV